MIDHFAVLRQPRRPWLDPDQLKQEYQKLTFARHPDKQGQGVEGGTDFAAITDAYRVLSNPKLRLQHLLSLNETPSEGESAAVTAELTDVFMQTGALVAEIDALLQKKHQASSTLAKSLLKAELTPLEKRTDAQLQRLQELYAGTTDELRRVDESWETNPHNIGEVRTLAQRFGFLDRWIEQLREKQFQLSN